MKLALRKKKEGNFETDFYNAAERDARGHPSLFPRDTPIEQLLCKRAQVTPIVQCTGIWFAGGKFGVTWKVVQMRVDSRPEQISGPAFRSDAPDIRAFVSKSIGQSAAPAADEDEYEEEEVVAAVLPPAPIKKTVAPAPDPVAFEEEAVAEPVPVPKKVVKKVVTAKKA